jgi:hypothetical protein
MATPSPAKRTRARTEKPDVSQEALAIMDLWNLTCPDLPQVRVKEGALHDVVMKSWAKEPEIELWAERFAKIQASDFYSGRDGKWRNCDMSWAVTTGRAKVDGKRTDGGNSKTPAQAIFMTQPSEVNLAYERHLAQKAAKEKADGNA